MKISNKSSFFTTSMLQWHQNGNDRHMPWKGEKDPYKIWLSEIMLQQTRVEQGLSYYLRFIKKFPDVHVLAHADDQVIFKMWEGLGYYSRCRNLIATARHISFQLNGIFPQTYDTIIALKGVGPYTAAAIASFAFNLPHAVVDGNVNRVIARYFGLYVPVDSTAGKKELANYATALLDKVTPGLYNQAIMDFGATICRPRLPLCTECFLSMHCKAYHENTVDVLPVKEKKIGRRARWFYYFVIEKDGLFAVSQRSGKDIWQSLHEFPLLEDTSLKLPSEIIQAAEGEAILQEPYELIESSPFYKQVLTHQDIYGCFTHVRMKGNNSPAQFQMMSKKSMQQLAFPKLINDYMLLKGWGKK